MKKFSQWILLVLLSNVPSLLFLAAHHLSTPQHYGVLAAHRMGGGTNVPVVKGLTTLNGIVTNVVSGALESNNLDNTSIINTGTYGDASHVPVITVDVGGRPTGYVNTPMVVKDQGGQGFNVTADKYGAVPGDTIDDYAAIQAAFNDAIAVNGDVLFPPGYYLVKSPINVFCDGVHGVNVHTLGGGSGNGFAVIDYKGPNGTSCFNIQGMNNSHWEIGVNLGGSGGNTQTAFDYQISSANLTQGNDVMYRCNVSMTSGGFHIGFRFGQYSASIDDQGSNMPGMKLDSCSINGDGTNTDIGCQIGGSQTHPFTAFNCHFSGCGQQWICGPIGTSLSVAIVGNPTPTVPIPVRDCSLFPNSGYICLGSSEIVAYNGKSASTGPGNLGVNTCTRGALGTATNSWGQDTSCNQYLVGQGQYPGASDVSLFNCGGSNNLRDMDFTAAGQYQVVGGRWENGSRWLRAGYTNSGVVRTIRMLGTNATGYTVPSWDSNGVIWINNNTKLRIDSGSIVGGSVFGSNMLTNNTYNNSNGSVFISDTTIQATSPFWTLAQSWPLALDNVPLVDNTGAVQSVLGTTQITLTDSPGGTVTLDLAQASRFILPMSGSSNNRTIAITNSANFVGKKFTLIAQQSSSGGNTITWPTIRWQGGSAPTLSGANKWDAIEFQAINGNTYTGSPFLNY